MTPVSDRPGYRAADAPTVELGARFPDVSPLPTASASRHALNAIRFGIVGLGGVAVNQVVLWALVEGSGLNYLLAAVLSAQVAITSNFVFTEIWVFRWRTSGSTAARLAAFVMVSNSTLLLQIPLLGFLTTVVGLHYLMSNALSVGLLFGARFVLSDRLIWQMRRAPQRLTSSPTPHLGPSVVDSAVAPSRRSAPVRAKVERALRILLAAAAVAGAYHYSLRTLFEGVDQEASLAHLRLVPLLALFLLVAKAITVRHEPDIHDRQIDYIVGLALLGLASVVLFVVHARLGAQFWLWRLDLAALPLYVAGVIALLFGLRTLWRVRAAVAFLLLTWPPLGRRLSALDTAAVWDLGDAHPGPVPLSTFAVIIIALALLVGGRVAVKACWLAAGLLFVWLLHTAGQLLLVTRGLPERLASVLEIVVAVTLMWPAKRAFGLTSPAWLPDGATAALSARRGWVVPRPGLAVAVVLIAGLIAAVANARLSEYRAVAGNLGEPRLAAFNPAVDRLPGWSVRRTGRFPVVTRYLGSDARWDRYSYRPSQRGASGSVIADVTSTPSGTALAALPPAAIYGLRDEPGDVRDVELGSGLTGHLEQRVPETGRGGWTMVAWHWPVHDANGRVRYERMTLLVTTPDGSGSGVSANLLGRLPTFARELVAARLAAADGADGEA